MLRQISADVEINKLTAKITFYVHLEDLENYYKDGHIFVEKNNDIIGIYHTGKHLIIEKDDEILVIDPITWIIDSIKDVDEIKMLVPMLHYQANCTNYEIGDVIESKLAERNLAINKRQRRE